MIDCVIFDLDGTLTRVPNPWRHVHERLGLWEGSASRHQEEWLSGNMCYEDFCRRDIELWKGRGLDEIEALLDEIELNAHVPGIVERLRSRSVQAIIISSGFSCVAQRIRARLFWEPLRIYANELAEGPTVRIHVSADADSQVSKKRLASSALEEAGLSPDRSLVVSDSERDLEMMRDCRYSLLVKVEDDLARVHSYLT